MFHNSCQQRAAPVTSTSTQKKQVRLCSRVPTEERVSVWPKVATRVWCVQIARKKKEIHLFINSNALTHVKSEV